MKGVFISLEGIEGTGKSTQARLLFDGLSEKGIPAVLTREPGGTTIGMEIRKLLLAVEHDQMDPITELLLYAAARRQHMAELVLPSLRNGIVVITDRFSDSTRAYQGYGRGLPVDLMDSLDMAVTEGVKPDLTVLLDIDVETGLKRNRRADKVDRFELESVEFHKKVQSGYHAIMEAEPQRVKLVDASRGIEKVHGRVMELVLHFLLEKGYKSGQ